MPPYLWTRLYNPFSSTSAVFLVPLSSLCPIPRGNHCLISVTKLALLLLELLLVHAHSMFLCVCLASKKYLLCTTVHFLCWGVFHMWICHKFCIHSVVDWYWLVSSLGPLTRGHVKRGIYCLRWPNNQKGWQTSWLQEHLDTAALSFSLPLLCFPAFLCLNSNLTDLFSSHCKWKVGSCWGADQ